MSNGFGLRCAVLLGALSALPSTTHANINLELRVPSTNVCVCDAIEVGLYAVSDDETDQEFIAFQVMIGWDANALKLIDVLQNGISWSLFEQDDCEFDQLSNELCPPDVGCVSSGGAPCNDGDARLDTFSAANVLATPAGVLAASFVFQAIGPGSSVLIRIIPIAGPISETKVLANDPASPPLTGTLGELILSVAPCVIPGDFDLDCRMGLSDHLDFTDCMNGPDGVPLLPACDPADFNGDGAADMYDAAAFQREFTGP